MILSQLTDEEAQALLYDWPFWARKTVQRTDGTFTGQQAPPGDWYTWLIMAGRGYGKTRTGAEQVRHWVEKENTRLLHLVGRTAADVRDVMVEGESGILNISPPWFMPHYEPSKRRLTWPNGARATLFSADEPNLLRGPQAEKAWVDEPAAWRYAEAFDQLRFGLRLGDNPQIVATTTPRPVKLIRELIEEPDTVITRGSTYENRANLSPKALEQLERKYRGTRLGRQELYAVLLLDVPGALWTLALIDRDRVSEAPDLKRIVVAIDPATTATEESSETGIIVGGIGKDDHGYVLDDLTLTGSPHEWASAAIHAFDVWQADRIVIETNQGGDMAEHTLRTIRRDIAIKQVRATRGKQTRAEPISAFYEQGLVHHVGAFAELEDQMTTWVPGDPSPDRMDALVWCFTELIPVGAPSSAAPSRVTNLSRVPKTNRRGPRS